MKYAYEDLSDSQFETLIVLICQRILGIGTQGFSEGPDGGRDAKFVGKAELHPSKAAPWNGVTIIQAKHTNGHNRTFSDSDFHSTASTNTILGKEVPRIKKLRSTKNLDHYMLFANRRLAGNAETLIRTQLAKECEIPAESIYLCGLEQLELWLKQFPDIPALAHLDLIDSPLIVSPDELAEVVQAFANHMETVTSVLDDPPAPRVSYEVKNSLNNMTPDYAEAQRKRYLKETKQVHAFLAAPENVALLQVYESAVDELQLKIIAKRKDYQTFDAVLEYLTGLLFNRDVILRRNKRLTRIMIFYMYWNCDIGKDANAKAD